MRRTTLIALCVVLFAVLVIHQSDAHGLRLKKLIKYGLIAKAFSPKKILFPLPLPLPIPVFQEDVHHIPYPVNHHTHSEIGYGFEHGGYGGGHGGGYGGGFGGGYEGGFGHGLHGGGY